MSEKSPAFQWYPKDCDTSEKVRAMDDREFGFYVRCLNHSWLNGGLPIEPAEIMRIIGRPRAYLTKVWPRVAPCFQPTVDGSRLVNPRQEIERLKQLEHKAERSRAGRNGNEKRWQEHRSAIAQQSPKDHTARNQRIAKHRFASAIATAYTDPEASVKDSTILGSNGELPPALIPIVESLRPHGKAIGKEPDLELVRKIAEASLNQPLTAASWIGKTWHRRFSERAVHRQPVPESLAYWVTAIREEAAGGWRS